MDERDLQGELHKLLARIDLLGVYPTWQTLLAQMVIAVAELLGFWINLRGGKPVPHRA